MAETQTPHKILRKRFEFEVIKVEETKVRNKYYLQIGEERFYLNIKEDYEELLKRVFKKISILNKLNTEEAKEELKKDIELDLLTILTKLEQF